MNIPTTLSTAATYIGNAFVIPTAGSGYLPVIIGFGTAAFFVLISVFLFRKNRLLFREIARKQQTEKQLLETERFNESVMRSTLDIVYIYDLSDHTAVYTNSCMKELLGYGEPEISSIGGSFHSRLIHPDDRQLVNNMLERCSLNVDGKVESVEFRMRDSVGRWLWFHGRYTVFKRDERGKATQVIGTLYDVTERVTMENALKIAFNRAQQYLDIVETIIVALDRDGRITLINRKGAQVLGYSYE